MLCLILIVGGLLIMMGQYDRSEALFYYFRLEDQVPETHLLRLIDKHISFEFVRQQLKDSYSETGRPSIDPELLLRILCAWTDLVRAGELLLSLSEFFNTHRRLHSQSRSMSVMAILTRITRNFESMPTRQFCFAKMKICCRGTTFGRALCLSLREISRMPVKVILAAILFLVGLGKCDSWGQENAGMPSVLHIQQSVTTSKTGFPQFLYIYQVLDGAKSMASARALAGNISIENSSANFSEVLWLLAYWEGKCPVNDRDLKGANFIWSDILKNPSQSVSQLGVDLHFPHPLPMTGCVGLVFGGGPLVKGEVTMSADLNLTYESANSNQNTVVDLSGEYCFGQDWGCQNATTDDEMGFGVPIVMPAGHLAELYGDISDSTFDGTRQFGPLPTGKAWSALNDFYLLPGGCGQFGENLDSQGFPNPVLLATLYSWLPENAAHLDSVPLEYEIPSEETGRATLQKRVERIFPAPVTVNSGDCIVVIYGRKGDGATDDETQVKAVLTP